MVIIKLKGNLVVKIKLRESSGHNKTKGNLVVIIKLKGNLVVIIKTKGKSSGHNKTKGNI